MIIGRSVTERFIASLKSSRALLGLATTKIEFTSIFNLRCSRHLIEFHYIRERYSWAEGTAIRTGWQLYYVYYRALP